MNSFKKNNKQQSSTSNKPFVKSNGKQQESMKKEYGNTEKSTSPRNGNMMKKSSPSSNGMSKNTQGQSKPGSNKYFSNTPKKTKCDECNKCNDVRPSTSKKNR